MNIEYKVVFFPRIPMGSVLTFIVLANGSEEAELTAYKEFHRVQGKREDYERPIVKEMGS